jgi:hypothetical protein
MKKCRENITFQIAVDKPITKQDTQENESTSLRAKLHAHTSSYAISPDPPQQKHFRFFKILHKKTQKSKNKK